MDKRYQIFVSSTYTDLRDERSKVIQTLMEMDCIPAGMELFPALDEEQWNFIKRVIDDCDYYLLIIGGRYGTVTPEGISYTEKEYDYAVERGLKVIALIHESPEQIPSGKTERSPEAVEKLSKFRDKVSKGRLVKFWTQADQLLGLVALSLGKTIKTYPAVGWVRANAIASTDALTQLNEAGKRIKELETQVAKLQDEHRERATAKYGGRTFDELARIFTGIDITLEREDGTIQKASLGDGLVHFADLLALGVSNANQADKHEVELFYRVARPLLVYGFADFLPAPANVHWQRIGLTDAGRHFVAEARVRVAEARSQTERQNWEDLAKELGDILKRHQPEERDPWEIETPAVPSDPRVSAETLPLTSEPAPAAPPPSRDPEADDAKQLSGGAAKKRRKAASPPKRE